MRDVTAALADRFNLTPEERQGITCSLLRQYPSYLTFSAKATPTDDGGDPSTAHQDLDEKQTPLELRVSRWAIRRANPAQYTSPDRGRHTGPRPGADGGRHRRAHEGLPVGKGRTHLLCGGV